MTPTDLGNTHGGRLVGTHVLVTGAGKGIGRAIVRTLVTEGASVTALSRNPADLATLADETGCGTIVAELANIEASAALVAARGPFDRLVNNAGINHLAPALDTSMEATRRLLDVNVLAPFRLAQVVASDLFRGGKSGAIVNVSSIAADVGVPDHAAYCASKAALNSLTRVLAVEWGSRGIRVNSVNPTITLTPMAATAWSDPAKSQPMLDRIPLGRFVNPEEVAHVVAFLLSDRASMLNGVSLDIDGGLRIR